MPEEFEDVPYDDATPNFGEGGVRAMTFAKLRDLSLNVFNVYMRKQAGLSVEFNPAALLNGEGGGTEEELEEWRPLLSVNETEAIVRDLSIKAGDGLYAVGGNTPKEAMDKVNEVMAALCARIMSNLTALAVKEGLLDAAFDDEENDFAFKLTEKGRQFGEKFEKMFRDSEAEKDEDADEC